MIYINAPVLSGVNAASSTQSNAIDASQLLQASAQVVCSATATGTIKFQASNDYGNSVSNSVPTNWSDISGASVTCAGGTVYLIPKFDICYKWIRIAYVGGGTGTVTVSIKVHGV